MTTPGSRPTLQLSLIEVEQVHIVSALAWRFVGIIQLRIARITEPYKRQGPPIQLSLPKTCRRQGTCTESVSLPIVRQESGILKLDECLDIDD